MALMHEEIVEEWLIRQGYFTIRGLKFSVHEIDLLAVKRLPDGSWDNLHVEVQVSTRPVRYITDLNKDRRKEFDIEAQGGAKKRSDEQLVLAVDDWIDKKFNLPEKRVVRSRLSGSDDWRFLFVHGQVRHKTELELINRKIELIDIEEILLSLQGKPVFYKTGRASDIVELIELANKKVAAPAPVP